MDGKFGKIYQTLIDNLTLACDNIKGEDVTSCAPEGKLALKEFWIKFITVVDALHHEVTKLSMAFSEPPYPNFQDTVDILSSLEASCINVLEVFCKLSRSEGMNMYREVHSTVLQLMENVIAVLRSIKFNGPKSTKERLKLTACVWETCDRARKLPKDNVQATVKLLYQEEMILLDASREIEEEMKDEAVERENSDDDVSEMWNDGDKKVLPPCVGLLKTAYSCVKKVKKTVQNNGKCEDATCNTQLDSLTEAGKRLSPAVDDFATSLYPPMNRNVVQRTAKVLADAAKAFLEVTKESHCTSEEDNSWIDFLNKAVDHNFNKLCLAAASSSS